MLLRHENSGGGQSAADAWAQANQGKQIHSVSPVFYRSNDGMFLASMADNSWDYDSHYEDVLSTAGVPKRYTDVQMESVLRAMDVDPTQRPIFMVHVAPEPDAMDSNGQVVSPSTLGYSVEGFQRFAKDGFERIVQRYRAVCNNLGWPAPVFVLVGCWHRDFNSLTREQAANASKGQSAGAYQVSLEQADVAFLSIYEDADGAVFDGNDISAETWLDANGYGDTGQFEIRGVQVDLTAGVHSGGELVQVGGVHQTTEQAAAFFAHRMWRMLVEDSCPNDVDGDYQINVNDLSYVLFRLGDTGLAGAGPTSLQGDANRDGVVDVNDISSVLFGLGEACAGASIGPWPVP